MEISSKAIDVAMEKSVQHIWLGSGLQKCKCGWRPRKDENLAVEIATHQTMEKLAAVTPIIASQALRDAADAFGVWGPTEFTLRDLADQLERKPKVNW